MKRLKWPVIAGLIEMAVFLTAFFLIRPDIANSQIGGGWVQRWNHTHRMSDHVGAVFSDLDLTLFASPTTNKFQLQATTGNVYSSGSAYFAGGSVIANNLTGATGTIHELTAWGVYATGSIYASGSAYISTSLEVPYLTVGGLTAGFVVTAAGEVTASDTLTIADGYAGTGVTISAVGEVEASDHIHAKQEASATRFIASNQEVISTTHRGILDAVTVGGTTVNTFMDTDGNTYATGTGAFKAGLGIESGIGADAGYINMNYGTGTRQFLSDGDTLRLAMDTDGEAFKIQHSGVEVLSVDQASMTYTTVATDGVGFTVDADTVTTGVGLMADCTDSLTNGSCVSVDVSSVMAAGNAIAVINGASQVFTVDATGSVFIYDQMDAASGTFGGGYGSTGCSLNADGDIWCNGTIYATVTGAIVTATDTLIAEYARIGGSTTNSELTSSGNINASGTISAASATFVNGVHASGIDAATATFTGDVNIDGKLTVDGAIDPNYIFNSGAYDSTGDINISTHTVTAATVAVSTGTFSAYVSGATGSFSGTLSALFLAGDGSLLTGIVGGTQDLASVTGNGYVTTNSIHAAGFVTSGNVTAATGTVSAATGSFTQFDTDMNLKNISPSLTLTDTSTDAEVHMEKTDTNTEFSIVNDVSISSAMGTAIKSSRVGFVPFATAPSISASGTWSVATWIKSADDGYNRGIMAFRQDGAPCHMGLSFGSAAASTLDVFYCGVGANWDEQLYSRSNSFTAMQLDGLWHHLAITHAANNTVVMYVDGAVVANTAMGNATQTYTADAIYVLGSGITAQTQHSSSTMTFDDVRVYNVVIPGTTVTALYNGTLGTESIVGALGTGLAHHYTCNETTPDPIDDKTDSLDLSRANDYSVPSIGTGGTVPAIVLSSKAGTILGELGKHYFGSVAGSSYIQGSNVYLNGTMNTAATSTLQVGAFQAMTYGNTTQGMFMMAGWATAESAGGYATVTATFTYTFPTALVSLSCTSGAVHNGCYCTPDLTSGGKNGASCFLDEPPIADTRIYWQAWGY